MRGVPVESQNIVPMYPIQELQCHVNALDEANEAGVDKSNLVGCQVLNKVLGDHIPTFPVH